MDLLKIGQFIRTKRKEKGLTQEALAEKLGVTSRAVSKWENGVCLPDADNMIILADILGVSINNLFSGEVIDVNERDEQLEKTLIELKKQKEQADKRLLTVEIVLGTFSVIALLAAVLIAGLVAMPLWARILVGIAGVALFFVGIAFSLLIEQKAGYYVCSNCGHRYVPTYAQVVFSMHVNRTRYMKCPCCHKRGWAKKVLNQD